MNLEAIKVVLNRKKGKVKCQMCKDTGYYTALHIDEYSESYVSVACPCQLRKKSETLA